VNDGYVDVVLRSGCKITKGTTALTSGIADFDIDTAILVINDVYLTSGGTSYPLERVSLPELNMLRLNAPAASPPRLYAVDSSMWSVYPTPTAADTLTLFYIARPTALSNSGDLPSAVPAEFRKLIEWYALAEGADYDDDQSTGIGKTYRDQYEDGLRRMNRLLSRRGGSRLPRIKIGSRRLVAHDNSTYP
jgi:hypothetical protein